MRFTYPVPPALAAEMHAAVRGYAERMQVSEEEAWAILNDMLAKELNCEVRKFMDAEMRRRIEGGE